MGSSRSLERGCKEAANVSGALSEMMDSYYLMEDTAFAPTEKLLGMKPDHSSRAVFLLAPVLSLLTFVCLFFDWDTAPYWFTIAHITASLVTWIFLNVFAATAIKDSNDLVLASGLPESMARLETTNVPWKLTYNAIWCLGAGLVCTRCANLLISFFEALSLSSFGLFLLMMKQHIQTRDAIKKHQGIRSPQTTLRLRKEITASGSTKSARPMEIRLCDKHRSQAEKHPAYFQAAKHYYDHALQTTSTKRNPEYRFTYGALQVARLQRDKCLWHISVLEADAEQLRARIRSLEAEKEGWFDVAESLAEEA